MAPIITCPSSLVMLIMVDRAACLWAETLIIKPQCIEYPGVDRLTPFLPVCFCSALACTSQRRIRGNGEVIKREEFEQRKEAADQARQARLNKKPKKLASQGKQVEEFPLLQVSHNNLAQTRTFLVRRLHTRAGHVR